MSKTGLSVFWGETARNAVSTSDHGYRCHVELDAETVRFDYVSITCRLRLVYVLFTCFTAENTLIYLFRAPHLLRILATGNYSVRLNRFTFESTVAPCRTYWLPFPETFLQKGSPSILVRMMSLLCEHKRHHPSQNIECSLYFCKKVFENLRMCNFCRIFDMLPHKWGPLRKYSRTLPDILFPISGTFLQKGLRPLFCRV